jgi:hypothetical protein
MLNRYTHINPSNLLAKIVSYKLISACLKWLGSTLIKSLTMQT